MRAFFLAAFAALLAIASGVSDDAPASSTLPDATCSADYGPVIRDVCYPHWLDLDGDGRDARQEVLERDSLVAVKRNDKGRIVTGLWCGPYTGKCTTKAALVDVDHRLALAEIHQIGGKALSEDQRRAIANDPLNLVAVWGPSNRQKKAKNTYNWLPPNLANLGEYLESREAVRKKYGLGWQACEKEAIALAKAVAKRTRLGLRLNRARGALQAEGGEGGALQIWRDKFTTCKQK